MVNIYTFLTAFFSLLVVVANLLTAKWVWIPFYPEGIPAGLLLYPLTFLINDFVVEIYGKKMAKQMVYTGFILALITWGTFYLISVWPEGKQASTLTFSHLFFGASVASSIAAYLFGQLTDIKAYDWISRKSGYLWLRSGGSTLISQLLDTVIVNGLLFLVFVPHPPQEVFQLMVASYLYKAVVAVMMVPIFYMMVYGVRYGLRTA